VAVLPAPAPTSSFSNSAENMTVPAAAGTGA
jgi:hypothetical protein